MESNSEKHHCGDLLSIDANMNSATPSILQLSSRKKSEYCPGSTFKPSPSSVLERARNFLPMLAQANVDMNQKLASLPPGALDIEEVGETEGPLIEMDIAVVPRDESETETDDSSDSDASDSGDDTDNEADSSKMTTCLKCTSPSCKHSTKRSKAERNGKALLVEVTESNLKMPGCKISSCTKPVIEILTGSSTNGSGHEEITNETNVKDNKYSSESKSENIYNKVTEIT